MYYGERNRMSAKNYLRGFVLSISLSLFLSCPTIAQQDQLINSIGVMGGLTFSKQVWKYDTPEMKEKTKFRMGYNGSVFAEWFNHDYYRMITEVEYNQKGGKDVMDSGTYKNGLDYVSANFFFKIRQELYSITPYAVIGPRVEFLIAKKPADGYPYASTINDFKTVHVTYSYGLGFEYIMLEPFIFLLEAQYNPDLTASYKDSNLKVKHKAIELRLGFKYLLVRNRKAKCPAFKS
jgi:hypothetical protein